MISGLSWSLKLHFIFLLYHTKSHITDTAQYAGNYVHIGQFRFSSFMPNANIQYQCEQQCFLNAVRLIVRMWRSGRWTGVKHV